MTSLIGIHGIGKSYGTRLLFKGIHFTIHEGEHIGLIGPNGAGKSTLVKILMGLEEPSEGGVTRRQHLRVGYASQTPHFPDLTIEEVLVSSCSGGDPEELVTKSRILLGKALFTDFSARASSLSGGWKKRLDIARALMQDPHLLILDEPTNHLDLEGILWLEKFLKREKCAYLIVSHDRYFLENVATKVVELNPCYPQGLFACEGSLSVFMNQREAFLEAQAQQERGLRSTVKEEVEWLRRSPKARTTKSRSRINKAHDLMDELSEVKGRNKTVRVEIDFSASERETRKLLVAKNLCKAIGNKSLFQGIDVQLSPGTRLGVVGKNGTGKTTLLKVLSNEIKQDMGTVKYADDLKIVYFDQHREQIPPDISLKEALSPNGDFVTYNGQEMHVNGWARRFLFSSDRLEMPVKCLSGGEKARILIAKLMLQPADILFLDEPTNDLDIPTLEVMEDSLKSFAGAVVLISHDRALMDGVCNQILGLGEEITERYFADYSQWETAVARAAAKKEAGEKTVKTTSPIKKEAAPRLSYKEQKELEGMEAAIESMEKQVSDLQKQLEQPSIQSDSQKSLECYRSLAEAEKNLETFYDRWQFLLDKTKK